MAEEGGTGPAPEGDGAAPAEETNVPRGGGESGLTDDAPAAPAEAAAAAPAEAAAAEKPAEGAAKEGEKTVKRGSALGLLRRTSRSIMAEMQRRKSQTIESMNAHDDAEEKAMQEDMKWKMPADFFYEPGAPDLQAPVQDNELPGDITQPCRFLGFDFHRHYNLLWTSPQEFCYITGHTLILVNTETNSRRVLHGRDSGGIGCVAMSPDWTHLAVGEKTTDSAYPPNVYIYRFENLKLYRILRKGTERGYASVKFSPHNKSHLAALGMAPDYLLSIFDWRNERLLLKCKAFGQDVYNVVWGNFPGQLTTCGNGHIRFWKMATTFTGLKLQGDIGKFGATELSDVIGFVELPDGKVTTGSEYGKLLLWEGVFVKVELMKTNPENPSAPGLMPHEGSIDVVMMDHATNCVVSGGEDGFLRWWPVEEIDEAEPDYDAGILEYQITMKKEIRVPHPDNEMGITTPAKIQHVARSEDDATWLIQDVRNGLVWKLDRKTNQSTVVISTHAHAVTGVAVMQAYPGMVVSTSLDGSLRAFNMTAEKEHELFLDPSRGGAGIVCMSVAPESVDAERRTVTCGYSDGVVRTYFVCKDGFALVNACKPHNVPVLQIAYSSDGSLLAVLGANNCIFFLEVRDRENQAAPLGFVQIHCQVNHMAWNDHESGNLLLALEDGTVTELTRPIAEMVDNTETYLIQLDYRSVLPELPEPPDEEDEDEEEEGEPGEEGAEGADGEEKKKKKKEEEVTKKDDDDEEEGEQAKDVVSGVKRVVYLSDDSVLFVGSGRYLGALWECPLSMAPVIQHSVDALGDHTPTPSVCVMHTKLPMVEATHLSLSPSERFLFIGFADGHVWIISLSNMQFFANVGLSDSTSGAIPTISSDGDEQMLCVGGADGGLYGLNLNAEALLQVAQMKADSKEIENSAPEVQEAVEATAQPIAVADSEDWDLPDVESPGLVGIPKDITDPETYSIQDAKMKSEEENAKAAAERQKRRVRDRIAEVRRELEEVQAKNQNIPYGQLSADELTIDPEYVAHLNKEMENNVEQVKYELAWSCEYHERRLQKLRDFFLGRLDFERIEVLAFGSPHRVSTFRCPSMSQELQANLARLHELIFAADRESDDEDAGIMDSSSPGGGSRRAGESGALGSSMKGSPQHGRGDFGEEGFDGAGSSGGERVLSGAELREIRRQQRQQRKQQMTDLEKAKPSDSYEDPQDVEAIAHAEATLGNYMLKTSDSYQVPENQRMNAEKKRRQMFLLEESMHAIKTEFNHRVLALRDFRQQVRAEVQRDLAALRDIDQQLGTDTPWAVGLLDDMPGAPPEFPERRFDHNENDMKAFGIQLRIAKGEKIEEEKVEEDGSNEDEDDDEAEEEDDEEGEEDEEEDEEVEGGGEGATIQLRRGEGGAKRDEDDGPARKRGRGKKRGSAQKGPTGPTVPISGRSALAARRIERLTLRAQLLQAQGEAAGPLGKAVAKEAQARLWHDKMQLEEHVRQVIDTFDGAVASIEKEKAKLESDLKNADMKLLVLYEELLTLNELEEKDEELLRKATKCRQDKTSIMHQIKECQDLLGEKKAEIEQWQNEETNLQAEFTELVGENSPFLGALLKIYKKKVKRSKRKKGMGDEEDFDEDEDEDEEDSDLESDEDDDVDEDDVGPPQGCDVQIYESVIDLREKRLDMEDALQEIQRAVDELKKTHTRLLGDERRIDKEQKQTDAEIQQFQTDKQRKLNQVQIVFALRLSQVQCLENMLGADAPPGDEKLPPELNEHVVFTHEGLNRLMARITELHTEIREVKANFRQLQRDFRLRKKEKNQAMLHIEDLQAKFQDIQMLKFGQTVDLDLIERSAPNKYVQELQERVVEAERDHRSRLAEMEKKIEKQKKELAKVTCDNTSLMEQIVSMGYSQMQLDAALNARIANVTVNDTEPLVELREMERERLKDLLNLQSKEIATLQAEINLFRKKGGHIYTTVTANRMPETQR
mmetsp:Transcript_98558/g.172003  ORF Transcript_98558/g.172003 Transcript_98558/m.172003 type:complete len:1962 (+) Transcript_98558:3-5888(+)